MSSKDSVTLKDIYEIVNGLESKILKRVEEVEDDVDAMKAQQNKFIGMMSIAMLFISSLSSFIFDRIFKGK